MSSPSVADLRRVWAVVAGDSPRQVLTCASAAAQVLLPTLWGPRFDRKDGPPNVIQPAAYTFTVWFPIFGSAIGYAGYQARALVRNDEVLRSVGWPLAGAFAATGIWAPLVRTEHYWSAQVALAGVAGFAEAARRRVARAESRGRLSSAQQVALAPVTGMLSAWGLAACGVNLAAMLVANRLVPAGAKSAGMGVGILATLGAAGASATSGPTGGTLVTKFYAGTLLWGLTGVVVGQRRRSVSAAVAAAAATVPIVVALANASPQDGPFNRARRADLR